MGYDRNPSWETIQKQRQDLLKEALAFQSTLPEKSVKADKKKTKKDVLPLTRENLDLWKSNPAKYDLEGVD